MMDYIRNVYQETLLTLDDRVELFVNAFRIRDIKYGDGHRQKFYEIIQALYEVEPECVVKVLPFIPIYGCYRDLLELMVRIPEIEDNVLSICKRAFISDFLACKWGTTIELSQIAKWLPREKSGMWPGLAKKFAAFFYPMENSHRKRIINYRKDVSFVNRCLGTVEVNMCEGTWCAIHTTKLSRRCFKKYKTALLNERKNGTVRCEGSDDREICREKILAFTFPPATEESRYTDASRYTPIADIIRARA
jgi:hypothetical protein